jgi:hypothetical protein
MHEPAAMTRCSHEKTLVEADGMASLQSDILPGSGIFNYFLRSIDGHEQQKGTAVART